MCLIFCAEKGVPTLDVMKRAERYNDDGAGIAWITQAPNKKGNVVTWRKGLNAEGVQKIIDEYKLGEFLPDYPFVVHFRACSSGPNIKELNHPFPISKEVETSLEGSAKGVLFHNGTFGAWENMMREVCFAGGVHIPAGNWNDSRALAWLVQNRGIGSLFLTNNGGGGRIAILEESGRLITTGNGWVEGEQKGVLQSSSVRDFTPSSGASHWAGVDGMVEDWEKDRRYGRHNSHVRGIFHGPSSEVGGKFKILKDLRASSLYEEGDEVSILSDGELQRICEEVQQEIEGA